MRLPQPVRAAGLTSRHQGPIGQATARPCGAPQLPMLGPPSAPTQPPCRGGSWPCPTLQGGSWPPRTPRAASTAAPWSPTRTRCTPHVRKGCCVLVLGASCCHSRSGRERHALPGPMPGGLTSCDQLRRLPLSPGAGFIWAWHVPFSPAVPILCSRSASLTALAEPCPHVAGRPPASKPLAAPPAAVAGLCSARPPGHAPHAPFLEPPPSA